MSSDAKVALITGCSSGMGLYAAVSFAQKGFKTYASMRNLAKADTLKEVAKEKGVEVEIVQLDVDDAASIKKCVEDIGRIDVLVNNAGFAAYGCIETMDIDLIKKTFETNVFGVIQLMQAVLPGMRERKSGLVINVSSISGILGSPFNDAYVSAKQAIEGLTEAMAPVYKQVGVNLVLVEPGATKTDFVKNVKTSGVVVPEEFKAMQGSTGKAFGKEFETAQTAEFLGEAIATIATKEKPNFRNMPNPDSLTFSACKLADPDGNKTIDYLTDYFGLANE